jgi:hypothetical protein
MLHLKGCNKVNDDPEVVDLMKVGDGEVLLFQGHVHNGHVLWHDLLQLLSNKPSNLHIVDSTDLQPLLRVAITTNLQLRELMKHHHFVGRVDFPLDATV